MENLEDKFKGTTDGSLRDMRKIIYDKWRRTEQDNVLMQEIDMEIERRKAKLDRIINE